MTEPLVDILRRALRKPGDVAASGIGAGVGFFLDAVYDLMPFADPLQVAAPSAALAVGVTYATRQVGKYGRRRIQARRALSLRRVLSSGGASAELLEELDRTMAIYAAGHLGLVDYEQALRSIAARYRQGDRPQQILG